MKQSLFRSIRRKLLNEGKLVRYLTYAVGEVVLIIVGIMIALQLNNWNEDRKAQAEFDEYIVQLREDVKGASENLEESIRILNGIQESVEFIPIFLDLTDYSAEDLVKFENGLNALGAYTEASIHVGLLGELLDGNKDIMGRSPVLAQKFLEIESPVEFNLSSLSHIYNQIDLDSSRMNQFRGKGRLTAKVPPKYNLEKLKSSDEFIYTSHSIASKLGSAILFSEHIAGYLESFLAVLEEYE